MSLAEKSIFKLYNKCKKSNSNFFLVIIRFVTYKILYNKKIFLHQRVTVKGIKNIDITGYLEVGLRYVGFIHKTDRTYLNIKGKLNIKGTPYSIGRGCRFDIGPGAVVEIGRRGYINSNSLFVIMHKLIIGNDCVISWNCQFLDDDFHQIEYEGRKESDNSIIIGDHVWIGSGAQLYKGTYVPDGCVVASNSVVRGVFTKKNVIIGGNPARVIKENINWE